MMKPSVLILLSITTLILVASATMAHQPRWVFDEITVVRNPEVSQVFYGILNGSPHYFQINASEPFNLLIGISVPDIPGVSINIFAEITFYDRNGFKHTVNFNGTEAEWIHFHEEFGNDDYLQGPRIRADTSYGICTIKIYSNESHAKYSLAIGEREEFSPDGILNTIILMPKIKSDFFGKSPFTAFFNPIGLFIFGPVILAVLLFLFLVWICRGMKHRNTDETQKTQK